MEKHSKEALQVSKEILVKFIESGRVSPTNFGEVFPAVYQVVLETITRPGGGLTVQSLATQGKSDKTPGQDS